jgi:hypothetical protein
VRRHAVAAVPIAALAAILAGCAAPSPRPSNVVTTGAAAPVIDA